MNSISKIINDNSALSALFFLLDAGENVGPRDFARTHGLSPRGGQVVLERLAKDGLLRKTRHGQYQLHLRSRELETLKGIMKVVRTAKLEADAEKFKDSGRAAVFWNQEVTKVIHRAKAYLEQRKN